MGRILSAEHGHAAEYARRLAGMSVPGRLKDAEQRVGAIERALLFRLRGFRGLVVGAGRQPIDVGADQRIWMISNDGTISITPVIGDPTRLDLTVANPGCTDVIKTISGDSGSQDAAGCTTSLKITGDPECGASAHIVTSVVAGIIAKLKFGLQTDSELGAEAGIAKAYHWGLGRCVTWTVYETSDYVP